MRAAVPLPVTRRRSAGQSLVEFALVIPIFLLMFVAVFDGGRLVYMNTVLSQAARESARLASVEASWIGSADPSCNAPGGPVCPASFDDLLTDVNAAANRMVAPFGSIPRGDIYISCDPVGGQPSGSWTERSCNSRQPGSVVSVRVELTYTAITPLFGQLVPPVRLSGSATMVIN
jgi:hypothetical protein